MNNINNSKILQSVFTAVDPSKITYTNLRLANPEAKFHLLAGDNGREFSLELSVCFGGVVNFSEDILKPLGEFNEYILSADVPTGYYAPINATDLDEFSGDDWCARAIGAICASGLTSLIFECDKTDSEDPVVKYLMSIGDKTFSMELESFDIDLKDIFIFD